MALGEGYFGAFYDAWHASASMHEADEAIIRALTRHLDGLEALDFAAQPDPKDALARLCLLSRRGAAWQRDGRAARAERDLAEVLRQGQALLDAPWADEVWFEMDTREQLADCWRERALVRMNRAEPDAAMDALTQALAIAPSPEVFADELAIHPGLAPLRARSDWSRVSRLQGLAP